MIKCFLVPMTDPPYSRENNQRPKFCDDLTWSGVPIFKKNYYLIKAMGTTAQLLVLQNQQGVFDFPNIDGDKLKNMPNARKTKNRLMFKLLDLNENVDLTTKQFINLLANSETMHGWDKDSVSLGIGEDVTENPE